MARLHGTYIFTSVSNLYTVSHNGCASLHSQQQWIRLLFPPHPCQYLLLFFDDSNSNWDEIKTHCGFYFQFLMVSESEYFFHVFVGHLYFIL